MTLSEIRVAGYRSIADLKFSLEPVTVVQGPNGCGKTNLYRSILLLQAAARGTLAATLAEEGGMPSALWAGPRRQKRRKEPVRLTIGVRVEGVDIEVSCGLPVPSATSLFDMDPEVKEEAVWLGGARRPSTTILERRHATAHLVDADGNRNAYPHVLTETESVLSQLRDPRLYPELYALRERISSWRFYHQFRSDAESPIRRPQVGVRTTALAADGSDLAPALQTIVEVGDHEFLADNLRQAFGARLWIEARQGWFEIRFELPGLARPLSALELSDGTLRYLCLVAALLSPRPPEFLALNEPETSLHPELFAPLAELVARAARNSQIWITTHAERLVEELARRTGAVPFRLALGPGGTELVP